MKFGIDRLLEDPKLRKPLAGKRVALLAHPASVTRDLVHSLDALAALKDIEVPRQVAVRVDVFGFEAEVVKKVPDSHSKPEGG